MATDLYDISVGTFTQILKSTINVVEKGREYFEANDLSLQDAVEYRLREDMMPLHFQIVSVIHHSLGALQGVEAGEFFPPSFKIDKDYNELHQSLKDALSEVQTFTEDKVNGFENKELVFKLGERHLPFEGGVFLKTFSLPNFYFHATTTYDMLRALGVPLGKMDFLGGVQTKA